MQYKKLEKYI